jgi:hypothetical protein
MEKRSSSLRGDYSSTPSYTPPDSRLDALKNLSNIGAAQAYDSTQSQAYRNVGSGLMLGGLFFQIILWIIYIIFFAKFQSRLRRDGEIKLTEDKAARVRATSLALYINIVTFMVILDKIDADDRFVQFTGSWSSRC